MMGCEGFWFDSNLQQMDLQQWEGIGFEFTEIRQFQQTRSKVIWHQIAQHQHASLILNSLQWTCLRTIHNNAMMIVFQAPCSNRLYYLESSCHILDSKTSGILDSAISLFWFLWQDLKRQGWYNVVDIKFSENKAIYAKVVETNKLTLCSLFWCLSLFHSEPWQE